MITSCSPGWIRFCEQHYPEFVPNLSSCKSPQQMFGSLVKTYYAEKMGIDPKDIVVVSIMPCTAKKYEVSREEQRLPNGCMPVDISLTTRELGRMITHDGILFDHLPDGEFDEMLGLSTGAATIFGVTGGVMEAAYQLPGRIVRVCVASGLTNARKVLDLVKSGEKQYDFIEFMACPGGCVNGGGQPIQHADVRNWVDLKGLRAAALYTQDQGQKFRKSHENPVVKTVYAEYLGEPGGHKAHEILHTTYKPTKRYRTDN